jgi:hypothetical protein
VPLFFFDVQDSGKVQKDGTGTELPDAEAARTAAMRFLPDIAREEIPRDGDQRAFVVLVTDEDGRPVYSATLNFAGLWLQR